MSNGRGVVAILGTVIMLGPLGCSGTRQQSSETQGSPDKPAVVVYVTNYPLKYFAERIGGEYVTVHLPTPADDDPAYWMPDAETIGRYQQADLILLNGAGYDKWIDAVSLPRSKLCLTSAEFTAQYIALEDAESHSHGPEGAHAHGGAAFTTWLDPTLAVKQANAIRVSLTRLRPGQTDAFQQNFNALETDLEALDQQIAGIVAKAPDRHVLFSHPVYQYFQRRYALRAKSVHWEPEQVPTEAMWQELEELLAEHPANWMIWEGEPRRQTETQLAKLGVDCATFAPCGNEPTEGDFLAVQRKNLADLAKVYKVDSESP